MTQPNYFKQVKILLSTIVIALFFTQQAAAVVISPPYYEPWTGGVTLRDVVNSVNALHKYISTAQSASLRDVVNSVNAINSYINGVVGATVSTAANLIYESNPSLAPAVTSNTTLPQANQQARQTAINADMAQIKSSLTTHQYERHRQLSAIPASDTQVVKTFTIPFLGGDRQALDTDQGNANFNIDSLINQTAYQSPQELQLATNFIQFLSDFSRPSPVPLKSLTEKQISKLQTGNNYRNFQMMSRSMIALQSAAVSNLNHMISQRTVQPNLGQQAGLMDDNGNPVKDASPLQVRTYMANRRIKDKKWYQDMSVASPTTLQRETLIVLTEIRQQLFDNQQLLERLLATNSALSLQPNQTIDMNYQMARASLAGQIDRMLGIQASTLNPSQQQSPGFMNTLRLLQQQLQSQTPKPSTTQP